MSCSILGCGCAKEDVRCITGCWRGPQGKEQKNRYFDLKHRTFSVELGACNFAALISKKKLTSARFELAHADILELESSSLDHSDKTPKKNHDSGEIRTHALKEQWISSPSP